MSGARALHDCCGTKSTCKAILAADFPNPPCAAQMNEGKGPEGMLEVRKAYEFALDRVGCDIGAGALWQEYTNFLQAPRPGTTAFQALYAPGSAAGQEEAHRTVTLRWALVPLLR